MAVTHVRVHARVSRQVNDYTWSLPARKAYRIYIARNTVCLGYSKYLDSDPLPGGYQPISRFPPEWVCPASENVSSEAMLTLLTASLVLLSTFVNAQPQRPHDTLISTLTSRQATSTPPQNCNTTCAAYSAAKRNCRVPDCGCNSKFLQAQGDCLVCQAGSPGGQAAVQFTLDAETNQCNIDGIPIVFKLQLPPAAQAIVDAIDRQSARLRQQQSAFLALQVTGGHVGLIIVLLFSVFSRTVHRDPTFLNFCITWIFSSIVYSLLLYRGTSGNSVVNSLGRVNQHTCLAQAALTNGAQVMTACSTMALVIQLWIGLRVAVGANVAREEWQKQWTTIGLLALPYIFFFTFTIPSVIVGRQLITIEGTQLQRVLPTDFYCTVVELPHFVQAVYGVTLGLLIITAIFDVHIINILYRHWWNFRHVQTKSAISLSILIRVMVFSVYRVIVAVAYGTVLNRPPQLLQLGAGETLSVSFAVPHWVDMLQAAIPLVGFLTLGINNDLLEALKFWRFFNNRRALSTMQTINTTNTSGTATVVDINTTHHTWGGATIEMDNKSDFKKPSNPYA